MAENPVEKSDIIKGDPIGEIKTQLDSALTSLTKFDEGLTKIAKTLDGSFKKAQSDTLKGINDINKAERESEKLLQEKIRTEQTLIKLDAEQSKLRKVEEQEKQQALKTQIAFAKETERLAKVKEREAKASIKAKKAVIDSLNPYRRLTKQVDTAQNRFKRLAVQYGENSKQAKRAEKNFLRLDKQLRRVNTDAKDGRRDVGRYGLATEKMGLSVRKVTGLLAQFGLAMGGVAIARSAVKVIADFDEKVADVAKTTNLTIKAAKELSLELLKIDTRTSITALQELASAAGRLGVEGKDDILAFTESADKVFVALGDDLGGTAEEIATNLGKVSANFGLLEEFGVAGGIERIGSSMNELSASGASSAGAILDFTNRMAGLSNILEVHEVQALGALFDESGQSIEVASSTLSKLLPTLATDFKEFAKIAGKTPETFKKIAETSPFRALQLVAKGAKNNEKGLFKLTKTLESFGVTSARAAGIVGTLANKTDRLTRLNKISFNAIKDNESVTDEFNKKNDTLIANYEKLKNQLTAYILGTEGATGASEKLKNSLKFITQNLGTIITVLGKLIKLFIVFKLTMAALKLKEQVANFKKFGGAAKNAGEGLNEGAKSAKNFGRALKGIGLGLAIGLILELAQGMWDVVSGAQAARTAIERLRKSVKKGDEFATARIENRQALLVKALAEEQRLLDQGKQTTEEFLAEKERLIKATEDQIKADIKSIRIRKDGELEMLRLLKPIKEGGRVRRSKGEQELLESMGLADPKKLAGRVAQLKANIASQTVKIRLYKEELEGVTEASKDAISAIISHTVTVEDNTKSTKKLNTALGEQNELLSRQLKLLHEIDQLDFDVSVRELQEQINEEVANAAKGARETAELDVDFIEELIQKKNDILKDAAIDRQEFEIATLKEQARIEESEALSSLEDKKAKLLKQEGLSAAQKENIEKQFQIQLQQLERDQLQRAADLELEIRLLKTRTKEELIEITKSQNAEINAVNDELIDAQIEGAEKLNEAKREADKKELEDKKEFIKTLLSIEQAITDALSDQIDRRIALKDKEISKAQEAQDFFKQLAANGNIEAKQSIKEQIEFEKEAQRERDRLERQKANLQLISSGIQTFTKQIEAGAKPGEALATTIVTTTALTAFLAGLFNFFEVGTMNAPEGMAVVDEKGAEIITDKKGNIKSLGTGSGARSTYLDSGDKVYTAAQTVNIMSRLDNASNANRMNSKIDSAGSTFDLIAMEKGISRSFDSSIKKMPHSNVNWQNVAHGVAKVVTDNVRGNYVQRTNDWIS
jgi:hypothetical protein